MNPQSWLPALTTLLCSLMWLNPAPAVESPLSSNENPSGPRAFATKGVVEEIQPAAGIIVIRHEAISNYMEAMTMPFKVKTAKDLAGFQRGDEILFQLHVTETESWVDQLVKSGTVPLAENKKSAPAITPAAVHPGNALLNYKFTNELGQAVSLGDFRGRRWP